MTCMDNGENMKSKEHNQNWLNDYHEPNDPEIDKLDQTVILLVSFIALILAMIGFSMSDMAYLFIQNLG